MFRVADITVASKTVGRDVRITKQDLDAFKPVTKEPAKPVQDAGRDQKTSTEIER